MKQPNSTGVRQPSPEEPAKTEGCDVPKFGCWDHAEHPVDWERYSGMFKCVRDVSSSYHFGTETIQKTRNDPSHHVQEDNELDREWRRKGLSNYLNDIWPPQPSHSICTIFRAPNYMRDCDCKAYEPTVATIGLFHFHKGRELSPRLHMHKSHCVSYLLARHGSREKAVELLEQCMNLVLADEPCARSCYSVDDGSIGRHEFAGMLLQDGCFILRLLLMQKKGESQEVGDTAYMSELKRWESEIIVAPMIGTLWIWNLVVYDLLKLENQIPFFVLQKLFDLLKTPADKDIDLVELALELLSGVYPARAKTFKPPPSSDVLHLLHLFHLSLISSKLENSAVIEAPDWTPRTMVTEAPDWIPSATVLQDAGIRFRPPNKRTAESFLEVTFENGVMEIPPLHVDDSTSLVFRNLIAFEQCYPNTATHITSYARFMDDLINTTRDVRLLSLDGVLLNRLGTEEAAADLLNRLCDQVHYTSDMNYLRKVFTAVTEYYETPWHKWRTALSQNYFSNPWVIISVLAAGVLLLLTIEQATFTAVAYFHPPDQPDQHKN